MLAAVILVFDSKDSVLSPYLVPVRRNGLRRGAWGASVCRAERGHLNFGQKPRGTRLEHRFVLRNEGRMPLIVRKVETPSFVGSDFAGERRLQPGESLVVKLKVELRAAGGVDADVCVITNDLKRPVMRLKIEGEVR